MTWKVCSRCKPCSWTMLNLVPLGCSLLHCCKVPEILPEENNKKVVVLHGWQFHYPMTRCRTSGNTALCYLEAIHSKVPEILQEQNNKKVHVLHGWQFHYPTTRCRISDNTPSCSVLP